MQKNILIYKDEFIRLGIFGDWDKPYITMDFEYESVIQQHQLGMVKTAGCCQPG